ncbi:hypothetical protein MDAP_001814 [Mitosporidium daphniae]
MQSPASSASSAVDLASKVQGEAADEETNSEDVYLVERILDEISDDDGVIYFLVKWQGYPTEDATWEPQENIIDEGLIAEWRSRKAPPSSAASKRFCLDNDLNTVKKKKNKHITREQRKFDARSEKKAAIKLKEEIPGMKQKTPQPVSSPDSNNTINEQHEISKAQMSTHSQESSQRDSEKVPRHLSLAISVNMDPVKWISEVRQASNASIGMISFLDAKSRHESKFKEWVACQSAKILIFCPTSLMEEWRVVSRSSSASCRLRIEPPSAAFSLSSMQKKWEFIVLVDPALKLINRPSFDEILSIKHGFLLVVTKIPIAEQELLIDDPAIAKLTSTFCQLPLLRFLPQKIKTSKKAPKLEHTSSASSQSSSGGDMHMPETLKVSSFKTPLHTQSQTSDTHNTRSKPQESGIKQQPPKKLPPLLTAELAELFSQCDDSQDSPSRIALPNSGLEIPKASFPFHEISVDKDCDSEPPPLPKTSNQQQTAQNGTKITTLQQETSPLSLPKELLVPSFRDQPATVLPTQSSILPPTQIQIPTEDQINQSIPRAFSEIPKTHCSTVTPINPTGSTVTPINPTGSTVSTDAISPGEQAVMKATSVSMSSNALALLCARPENPTAACNSLQILTFSPVALADYINRAKQISEDAKKALLMIINPQEGAWTLSLQPIAIAELPSILFQFISQAQRRQAQGWLFLALHTKTETFRAVFIPKELLNDLRLTAIGTQSTAIPQILSSSAHQILTAPSSKLPVSAEKNTHVPAQDTGVPSKRSGTWPSSPRSIPAPMTPLCVDDTVPSQVGTPLKACSMQSLKTKPAPLAPTSSSLPQSESVHVVRNQGHAKPLNIPIETPVAPKYPHHIEELLPQARIVASVSTLACTSVEPLMPVASENHHAPAVISTILPPPVVAHPASTAVEAEILPSPTPITSKTKISERKLPHKCHWIGCYFSTAHWNLLKEHMGLHLPVSPPCQLDGEGVNRYVSEPPESLLALQARCLATYQQWSLQLLTENDRLKCSIDILKTQVASLLARSQSKR